MVRWESWSGWRVEEVTLDRGRGPVRLIRVTYLGTLQGDGSAGLWRGYYRSVDEVHTACPGLPWDELEEQIADDPDCE